MAKTIQQKLQFYFSLKTVNVAVILFSILGRILQLVFFYNIRVDASYQVMAMQNFTHGHGFTFCFTKPSDLSNIIYEPLINWPPGYSLLLSPFYLLLGHNYIAAGITLDILCSILLIFMSRRILTLLDVPLYLVNLYTLLTGFFIYSFYFIASSDAIAISIFITAIYYTLLFFKEQKNTNRNIFLAAICLLLCAWIKYLFIPVVFVIPLFFLYRGFLENNKRTKKAGFISVVILLIGTTGLLAYQKLISGSATYISQPERGFFPKHILDSYPLLPASIIAPDTIARTGIDYGLVLQVYRFLHIFLVGLLLVCIIKTLYRKRFRLVSPEGNFAFLSFLISTGIYLVLLLLSLMVAKEEIVPGVFWTYVEEPRYYGLAAVLLHLSLFIFLNKKNLFLYRILFLLIILLSVESFRGLYLDARRVALFNKEEYAWHYEERFQKYADSLIQKEKIKHKVRDVVVTGSSYFMNHRVVLCSHIPVMYELSSLNHLYSIRSAKPILLLVILQKDKFNSFKQFLSDSSKEMVGQFDEYYFYTYYISPN